MTELMDRVTLKAHTGWTMDKQATKTNERLTKLEEEQADLAELVEEVCRGLGTILAAGKRYIEKREQRRYPRKRAA